jgi:hypothetical protein
MRMRMARPGCRCDEMGQILSHLQQRTDSQVARCRADSEMRAVLPRTSDPSSPYPAAMRVASPDSPYSQTTSEMMETRVVVETVDATIISSQRYSPARM